MIMIFLMIKKIQSFERSYLDGDTIFCFFMKNELKKFEVKRQCN